MKNIARLPVLALCLLLLNLALCACSPKFDWREFRGSDAPFSLLMPAKPASFSREMRLSETPISLQMTAADVGDIHFAVGYARVDDSTKLMSVRDAMKLGMLNNIHASITSEKAGLTDDIEARGSLPNGQAVRFFGRFTARAPWVYQVVVIGPEKSLSGDIADTFLNSFKID